MHKLIGWYRTNGRSLPWRETKDPYTIWLSEIILQQTRVEQGLPYYLKITEAFPTVFDLANAKIDEVLLLWQGLGYYSRARNLHETAKNIAGNFDGKFPENYQELLKLKGIGEYTASAIASIAFNAPFAVLDGNVFRVLARYCNVSTPVNSSKGKKQFSELAQEFLNTDLPGQHNEAIMELGATVCTPLNPKCNVCPLNENCRARLEGIQNQLPVKHKKIKVKKRYFIFIILTFNNKVYIQKRGEQDIWKDLYQFPLIECDKKQSRESILIQVQQFFHGKADSFTIQHISEMNRHMLSHQHIYAHFVHANANLDTAIEGLHEVEQRAVSNYAMPRLITRYLENTPLE